MDLALAYVPCSNEEEAHVLAQSCVEKRLAICANVLPQMTSFYHSDGKVVNEAESLLLLKHIPHKFDELKSYLEEHHSYHTPCVTQIQLHNTLSAYLDWAKSQQ